MNCNNPTKGRYNFQGVVVCSHCLSVAKMCIQRADKQLEQLKAVYVESVRVSLASGSLRPTERKEQKGKMPTLESLRPFLQKIIDGKDQAGGVLQPVRGEAGARGKG